MAILSAVHPGGNLAASDNIYLTFSNATNGQVISTSFPTSFAKYDNASFPIGTQDTNPTGVAFNTDGTKMYVTGLTNDSVYQYTLSTAWSVATATYDSVSFSVAAQDIAPYELFFRSDGTKMYIMGNATDTVYQYTLSTAWAVNTATYDGVSFSVAGQETNPWGLFFKSDGTKMYVVGTGNDTVYQYTLSTAWAVNTAVYDNVSFSVASQATIPTMLSLTPDGMQMHVMGTNTDTLLRYDLSTGWDVSTATYKDSFSVAGQDSTPYGFRFSPDQTKLYILGSTNQAVFQYVSQEGGVFPSDLGSIDTMSWKSEHSITATHDDSFSLGIRVMSGSTVLAAADSAGTYVNVGTVSGTTDVVVGPTAFAYVNTTAGRELWNAGQVDLRQTWAASMATDAAAIRVDNVEFTGTYTQSINLASNFTSAGDAVILSWANTGAASYTLTRDGATIYTGSATKFTDNTGRGLYTYQVTDGVLTGSKTVDFRVYSQSVLADNPISLWRMNESSGTAVADHGVKGTTRYPGTIVNGANPAVLAQPGPTKEASNAALYLNNGAGTSNSFSTITRLFIGAYPQVGFGPVPYTIEGWFMSDSTTDWNGWNTGIGDWSPLIGRRDVQFAVRSSSNTDKLAFSTPGTSSNVDVPVSTVTLLTKTWWHVAVVLDTVAMTKYMYLNGDLHASATFTGTPNEITDHTVNPLIIAGQEDWPSTIGGNGALTRASSGYFSEWAIYDTALTPERIKSHYNARLVTAPTDPPATPTGLAAVAYNEARIDVSWGATAITASYTLEYSTNQTTWTAITGITDTSYSHTGLTADTTYYYRVTAVNGAGASAPSAVVSEATYPTPNVARVAPDTIITQTNLTGALSTIQDDPDAPDANWMVASGDITLHLAFPAPNGELSKGAGRQEFRIQVRQL